MLTILNKTFHLERIDRMLGLYMIRPLGCMMQPVALFYPGKVLRDLQIKVILTIKINIVKF